MWCRQGSTTSSGSPVTSPRAKLSAAPARRIRVVDRGGDLARKLGRHRHAAFRGKIEEALGEVGIVGRQRRLDLALRHRRRRTPRRACDRRSRPGHRRSSADRRPDRPAARRRSPPARNRPTPSKATGDACRQPCASPLARAATAGVAPALSGDRHNATDRGPFRDRSHGRRARAWVALGNCAARRLWCGAT